MRKHSPDLIFLGLLFILIIIGFAILSSVSAPIAKVKFNNPYFYLEHQLEFGFSLGVLGFLFGYYFYYLRLKKISLILLIFNIVLLVLVFSPLGITQKGATRWLNFFGIWFQPSQLLKLTFFLYLSAWLSLQEKSKSFKKGYLPFLIICSVIGFLLIKQPATSFCILTLTSALILYFLAGARFSFISLTFLLGLIIFMTLIIFSPYRMRRVSTFLNPNVDPQGASYQINQGLIAIGSGGIFGKGFGSSVLKRKFLPEVISDSVFSIICEELGFIRTIFLLLLYFIFTLRIFKIGKRAPDDFSRYFTFSVGIVFLLESLIHIASNLGLLPFCGLGLPLISYSSSSLVVYLTLFGIVAGISRFTL
ncbi:FtsW/RodA/SpoVE family cell cycle protein [bacterium]|nr:FtsW/RodA/SpoVE family cell cycle protein [bacterium]